MVNYIKYTINLILTGSILLFLLLLGESLEGKVKLCFAGNKEHVVKRVVELESVNKKILEKIPDLPDSGRVKIKAHVIDSDENPQIIIIEKKIETMINEDYDFLKSNNITGH